MPQISTKLSASSDVSRPFELLEKILIAIRLRSEKLIEALRHRTEVNALTELDARTLADIGLTRGDVLASLDQPLVSDPSLDLARRRNARRAAVSALKAEISAGWNDPFAR